MPFALDAAKKITKNSSIAELFKFFGQLPFYDRKISNDLKISKKFYTFRL